MKSGISFFIFLLACLCAFSQERSKMLEIGFAANALKGDLNPDYQSFQPSFLISYRFYSEKRVNGRFQFTYGNLVIQNLNPPFKEISQDELLFPVSYVKTRFFGLHYEAIVRIVEYEGLRVGIAQGIGTMRFDPQDINGNSLIDRNATRAKGEEYNNISLFFPSSLMISYLMKDKLLISGQLGWMNPVTDYLDNLGELAEESTRDNALSIRVSFGIFLN